VQWYHFSVSRAGYLLAGGRSTRMGRDKALLPFRGGRLAEVVARAVEEAAGSVTVVGRPELLAYPTIADLYPGEGPLGGILTALAHSHAEWNLVVACDMPEVTSEFLAGLLDRATASGRDALIPSGPSGRREPLCAVYRSTAREALEREFARGVRKVMAAVAGLDAAVWVSPQVAHFQNVNTPEDWAGYAAE
jgi:molybdopterin-guanine dinucleotide biosynthesis protein A